MTAVSATVSAADSSTIPIASLGTKVFGFHVSDGEKTYYRRTDFVGALKEELIPEWAKENTQKYLEADDLADEPDEDGGMTMNM